MDLISLKRLREVLTYDPTTGTFIWRLTLSSAARAGVAAGSIDANGYRRIAVDGQRYLAHRLAWFYAHGVWPQQQIDHIDGNRDNNASCNLRDVDACTNQQNRHRAQGANRFPWVTWKRAERRWRGAFQVRQRHITVGYFQTAEAAYSAVIAKRTELGLNTEGAPPVPVPEPATPTT